MALIFWENVNEQIRQQKTTQEWLAKNTGIKYQTLRGWITKDILPRVDQANEIAKTLGTTVSQLLNTVLDLSLESEKAQKVLMDPSFTLIPILNQRVAAGRGQELLDSSTIVGMLPFLRKMLRGETPDKACALEVRGDSMTGIQIFDGDLVVFVPGSIRGDGIYVLMVNDSLIVKRVEFDEISKKIRIMSENPRYPERIESADGQTVQVIGKVYGWVHSHPY